jgi:hypothetical protein
VRETESLNVFATHGASSDDDPGRTAGHVDRLGYRVRRRTDSAHSRAAAVRDPDGAGADRDPRWIGSDWNCVHDRPRLGIDLDDRPSVRQRDPDASRPGRDCTRSRSQLHRADEPAALEVDEPERVACDSPGATGTSQRDRGGNSCCRGDGERKKHHRDGMTSNETHARRSLDRFGALELLAAGRRVHG